jgi:hypothetical protein
VRSPHDPADDPQAALRRRHDEPCKLLFPPLPLRETVL